MAAKGHKISLNLADFAETIPLRVTPKAARNLLKVGKTANGNPQLRVYVTTPPEDGKANKAAIALVAKAFGVAPSAVTLVQGATARDKLIRINPPGTKEHTHD